MATVRQRPKTARGTLFMTLDDEAGSSTSHPGRLTRFRRVAVTGLFLSVRGTLERSGKVVGVKAARFEALPLGPDLDLSSRDFP